MIDGKQLRTREKEKGRRLLMGDNPARIRRQLNTKS